MTDFSVPMPPYSSIKRSAKPIRPKKHAQVRVGKLGIVRLTGKALEDLRYECFLRWGGICCGCGVHISDLFPDWHGRKYHMAHIVGRGAGGSDVISNVRALCGDCHRAEHGNPLPRK